MYAMLNEDGLTRIGVSYKAFLGTGGLLTQAIPQFPILPPQQFRVLEQGCTEVAFPKARLHHDDHFPSIFRALCDPHRRRQGRSTGNS